MFKINEIFESLQGEGVFTGCPAIFLRLQGCPVECSWCDTKQTWRVDIEDKVSFENVLSKSAESPHWCKVSTQEILDYCQTHFTAKHLVITGGEPCIYDLTELTAEFEKAGYRCQIETSGTFEVQTSENTWVTVSPKINMRGGLAIQAQSILRANEIKHPVGTQKDIDALQNVLSEFETQPDVIVSLQPISQKLHATQLCIETCIKNNWRLSVQTHKYLNII